MKGSGEFAVKVQLHLELAHATKVHRGSEILISIKQIIMNHSQVKEIDFTIESDC